MIKLLESEILKEEKEQNPKLTSIFSKQQLATLRVEYKGSGNAEANLKPKLQILASFVIDHYKCSGPDRSPICLYDYTFLSILNNYFVFSVPTENIVTEKNNSFVNTLEEQKQTEVKLTKGTNLSKLVDPFYLDHIKPGDPQVLGKKCAEKNSGHENVVPISQGYHLCHDEGFTFEFNKEFKKVDSLAPEAANINDMGKIFGSDAFYEKTWFTVQEAQEKSLTSYMT